MKTYNQSLTPAWMQLIEDRGEQRREAAIGAHAHLRVALTSYFVDLDGPLDGDVVFDLDSMVHTPVVSCLICEQFWTPRIYGRRCKGDPHGRPW
jgi:hypothetical protein